MPRTITGTDLAAMRRLNGHAILSTLWHSHTPTTVTQLASSTGLSRTTVEAVLADLVTDSLVVIDTSPTRGTGRPARQYRFAAERGALIAIDIGPHSVTGMIGDLRGAAQTDALREEGIFSASGDALRAITDMTNRLLAETRFTRGDVRAITVALPGIVDSSGTPTLSSVVPEWISEGLAQGVRAAFPDVLVTFDNDTKLAAVAEATVGAMHAEETAVLIRIGHRISAATVVDGRVSRGAHGAAGEIGALARMGWRDALTGLQESTGADVFVQAGSGDVDAQDAITRFAEEIGDGLAALCLTLDPHAIVINTSRPDPEGLLSAAVRTALAPRTLYAPDVRRSDLGADAAGRGALIQAAGHIQARMFSV